MAREMQHCAYWLLSDKAPGTQPSLLHDAARPNGTPGGGGTADISKRPQTAAGQSGSKEVKRYGRPHAQGGCPTFVTADHRTPLGKVTNSAEKSQRTQAIIR